MGRGGIGPTFVKRTIRRNSIRKGLLGGSRLWLTVFALRHVSDLVGKVAKRGEMPVRYREPLAPGEQLVITHTTAERGRV